MLLELRHRVSCLELLEGYLNTEGVAYTIDEHPPRYTAQELAQVEHVSGRLIAKAVMTLADGHPVMVVVPGVAKVDLGAVRKALGAQEVRLAVEEEFGHLFPDCEIGAMPPFGNLYGVPVLVDAALAGDPVIFFNAGSHRRTATMTYADYARLVHPAVGAFAKEPAAV
jgi:Ala-tRNA(Pro) deacylase